MNLSLLYAIPAIPMFAVGWYSQVVVSKKLRKASQTATPVVAEDALAKLLKEFNLNNVEVAKSDDYTQNEFDDKSGKIKLSPDTFGSVDVASVALALHAGSHAETSLRRPEKMQGIQKLHYAELLLFWIAFCVLAFGIMSANLPVSIVGYVLAFVVWSLTRARVKQLKEVDAVAVKFLKESNLLSDQLTTAVLETLDAERNKL